MEIMILGSGTWGTAVANMCANNGHDITLWSFDPVQCAELAKTHTHPFLPGGTINNNITFTDDITLCANFEHVIIATPSFAIRETAKKFAPYIQPGTHIINLSKGLEKDTLLRLSQVITQELGGKDKCESNEISISALGGPSQAEEVFNDQPTVVVVSNNDINEAIHWQKTLNNPKFRVYVNNDMIGTEICACLKNVIALCAGIVDGLGYGDNTNAALITRGLAEISRLGIAMGAKFETFLGLAGMGDLIGTAMSVHSRNRTVGKMLGDGMSLEDALDKVGMVAEGVDACVTAVSLADKHSVELPISTEVYRILFEGKDARQSVIELMCR
ncbi:MAG: NAD(P)-dependent glycerol-3-phosphate dehydrogenase [Clostridiales bacterium]|jgi:glycerol-3-phosphate dehydrogenase (NAD(P)+)|nr:NAD(P)-dependent glycerol-3-phosphate dehydrogenase [Clostridiales bacterium]